MQRCPKCNQEAKIIYVDDIGYFINCDCGIILMNNGNVFKNKEDAIKSWNKRTNRVLDSQEFKTCYFCGKEIYIIYDDESGSANTYCYLLCDCGMEFHNSESSWFNNSKQLKEIWNQ